MRQRTIRNRDAIYEKCRDWQVMDPSAQKGHWQALFGNGNPIQVEVGSGKGRFICAMAEKYPQINFVAIEGGPDIAIRILQKAAERGLSNVKVIVSFVEDIREYFAPGEIFRVYVNFCDPWPKKRHAKRRLVHRNKIEAYNDIMGGFGTLEFRTDNDALFDFALEEFAAGGWTAQTISRDLHREPFFADMVMTEYEEKFSSAGKNINYALVPLCSMMKAQE